MSTWPHPTAPRPCPAYRGVRPVGVVKAEAFGRLLGLFGVDNGCGGRGGRGGQAQWLVRCCVHTVCPTCWLSPHRDTTCSLSPRSARRVPSGVLPRAPSTVPAQAPPPLLTELHPGPAGQRQCSRAADISSANEEGRHKPKRTPLPTTRAFPVSQETPLPSPRPFPALGTQQQRVLSGRRDLGPRPCLAALPDVHCLNLQRPPTAGRSHLGFHIHQELRRSLVGNGSRDTWEATPTPSPI